MSRVTLYWYYVSVTDDHWNGTLKSGITGSRLQVVLWFSTEPYNIHDVTKRFNLSVSYLAKTF